MECDQDRCTRNPGSPLIEEASGAERVDMHQIRAHGGFDRRHTLNQGSDVREILLVQDTLERQPVDGHALGRLFSGETVVHLGGDYGKLVPAGSKSADQMPAQDLNSTDVRLEPLGPEQDFHVSLATRNSVIIRGIISRSVAELESKRWHALNKAGHGFEFEWPGIRSFKDCAGGKRAQRGDR